MKRTMQRAVERGVRRPPHGNPVPSGAFAVGLPKTHLTMTARMSKNIGAKSEVKDRHVISPPTFLRLMRSQLARDRDSNCEPLYIQGARGALFKLTLASHGYTGAAKGTILDFIPDLQHEATVLQTTPLHSRHVRPGLPWGHRLGASLLPQWQQDCSHVVSQLGWNPYRSPH
jgi:hypothetical protein